VSFTSHQQIMTRIQLQQKLLTLRAMALGFIFMVSAFQVACKPSDSLNQPKNLKVAFLGDQSVNANAKAVLQLLKDEGVEVVLHLGDLGYENNSPANWEKQINDVLGADFAYFAVIGNHEGDDWPDYQQRLKERLKQIPQAQCRGDLGVKSFCHYKGLFFVMVAPGIDESGHNPKDNYDLYLADQLAGDQSLWSICAWHMNQTLMQTGDKENEAGWGVYEACREGGGIVATAHEHAYSRTHLMSNFEHQTVADRANHLVIQEGETFAFVSGLAGHSIQPQLLSGDWWAAIYTSSQNASYGALICTFGLKGQSHQAACEFKAVDGTVADSFSLESRFEDK
jgi:hypothetical protein